VDAQRGQRVAGSELKIIQYQLALDGAWILGCGAGGARQGILR
jgi:hypothetical protein